MAITYHYLLMSQTDFLESQVVEEILRERANFYISQKKKDFWLLIQPNFAELPEIKQKIKNTNFYQQELNFQKRVSNNDFLIGLISVNKEFIKWVALRLGYFENLESDIKPKTAYTSNGIIGTIEYQPDYPILKCSIDCLHPDILLTRYKQSIEYSYMVE